MIIRRVDVYKAVNKYEEPMTFIGQDLSVEFNDAIMFISDVDDKPIADIPIQNVGMVLYYEK